MWHVNCKFAALNRPYGISLKQCILTRWMCVQSHKEDTAKANQPLNIQFVGKICLLSLPYVMYAIYLNWCVSCFMFLVSISFHDMCYSYRPIYEWYAATCAAGELFIVFVYRILKASAHQLSNWIYSSFRVTTSQRTNFNIWHKIWLWIQASNHLQTLYLM